MAQLAQNLLTHVENDVSIVQGRRTIGGITLVHLIIHRGDSGNEFKRDGGSIPAREPG